MTNHVRPARRVHVVEDGSRTAPSMLLIHGTAGSVAWWDPVIPALTQQRHVVRVDLPGHGHSAPARSYAVVDQAHRVSDVLDELGLDSVTVVGHSSGSNVATALAEQRPDIVRAVALINSGPTPDALGLQARINRLVSAPLIGRMIWTLRSDTSIRKGLSTAFTRPVDIPDHIVNAVRNMTYHVFTTAPRESLAYIAQRAPVDASRKPRRPTPRDLRRRGPGLATLVGTRLQRRPRCTSRTAPRHRPHPHVRGRPDHRRTAPRLRRVIA
jgi:pimeloyl-ACP methyl ester carboxylesterase